MSNRRRLSLGERLSAAASIVMMGAAPGRFGPYVSSADWNGRFNMLDDVVSDENVAANVSGVYACSSILSDTIAGLPISVVQREAETRKPLPDHPVSKLFSGQVNDYQGRHAAMKTIEAARQLRGNGYLQVERDKGVPVGLWPLMSAAPRRTANGRLVYQATAGGGSVELSPSDVIHIRGFSTVDGGMTGISPIWAARNAIALTLQTEKFGREFFANDARSGGYFTHPGKMSDKAIKNFRDSIENQSGDDGRRKHFGVKVLEDGVKYTPVTIAPEEAQFLTTRQFQLEEICRWYRVPLVLVQSVEKTTSWGTGVEQLMIGFAQWTIAPLAASIEEELTLKLLTEDERSAGMYVHMDVRGMMRGDAASRAAYLASGIQNNWLLPNEARAMEGLNPIAEGDAPVRPTKPPP